MNRNDKIKLAAKLLMITAEQAEKYSGKIDEVSAMYFSVPEKGGGSLIISDDGGVLYADSSVGYKRHLEAYKQGIRTPID